MKHIYSIIVCTGFFLLLTHSLFSQRVVATSNLIEGARMVSPGSTESYSAPLVYNGGIFYSWHIVPSSQGQISSLFSPSISVTWRQEWSRGETKLVALYRKSLGFSIERLEAIIQPCSLPNTTLVASILGESVVLDTESYFYIFNIFRGGPRGNQYHYRWLLDGEEYAVTTSSSLNIDFTNISLGEHVLRCIPLNECGEENPAHPFFEKTITVKCAAPTKIREIEGPRVACVGRSYIYTVRGGVNADEFVWDIPEGVDNISYLNDKRSQAELAFSTESQSINITVTPMNGCAAGVPYTGLQINTIESGKVDMITFGSPSTYPDAVAIAHSSPQMLTLNNCEEIVTDCSRNLTEVTLTASLDLGDTYNFGATSQVLAHIPFVLKVYDKSEKMILEREVTLNLNNLSPRQVFEIDLSNHSSDLNALGRIEVMLQPGYSYSTLIANDIRLQVFYEEELEIGVDAISVQPLSVEVPEGSSGKSFYRTFRWSPSCSPYYELQVLKSEGAYYEEWGRALTIVTESNVPEVTLALAEGTGEYYWRVRPVGSLEGRLSNPRNKGQWSYESWFYFASPDEDKNWAYSRVFSEGNKIKEGLSFANGLLQPTQSQTRLVSKDIVVINETRQDYVGRNVLTSLPVPVKDKKWLGYKEDVLTQGAESYSAAHFDGNPKNPLPAQTVTGFYSGINNGINAYVPDAEGFPYSRTLFTTDGTGRVVEQAGPGLTHSMKGERTIRTYYSGVADQELSMLFGQEAPKGKNAHKVITVDANGTSSVLYKDKSGRTLATALSRSSGGASLLPLNSSPVRTITETIEDASPFGTYGSTSNKPLVLTEETAVTLRYSISPQTISELCNVLCATCDYKVVFFIHDKGAPEGTIQIQGPVIPAGACPAPAVPVFEETRSLPPGEYVIEKRIESYTRNPVSEKLYIDEQLTAIHTFYENSINTAFADIDAYIANNNVTGLYDYLILDMGLPIQKTGEERFIDLPVSLREGEGQCIEYFRIPYLEEDCTGTGCKATDFEAYFLDYWLGNDPDHTALLDNGNYSFLPAYAPGEFDAMIHNMITDTELSYRYGCTFLWENWVSAVHNYGAMKTLEAGAENTEGFSYDLLKSYFQTLSAKLAQEERQFLQKNYYSDSPDDHILTAYKEFYFDSTAPSQIDCKEYYCPTGTCDSEGLQALYRCSLSSPPAGLNVESEPIKMQEKIVGECETACEDRRAAFRQKIVNELYASGGKYLQVSNGWYPGAFNEFTGQWEPSSGSIQGNPEWIYSCEIETLVQSLVDYCKGTCDVSIQYDENGNVTAMGTEEEIEMLNKAMLYDFEVKLNEGEVCSSSFEHISIQKTDGYELTECSFSIFHYINEVIQVSNALLPLDLRTNNDKIGCPLDQGIGENTLNIFSYVGPLKAECSWYFPWMDCRDPYRNNFWVSVNDDRRASRIGSQGRDYNFQVIWGSTPGNYTYYGACSPDPTGFDNPEFGVPKLLIPVRDVNGDGDTTACGAKNNHLYMIKFFVINDLDQREYVFKDDIMKITNPRVLSRDLVIPTVPLENYNGKYKSDYVAVDIHLKTNEIITAYVESGYNHDNYLAWKGDRTCGSRFDLCFRWTAPQTVIIPEGFEALDYEPKTCEELTTEKIANAIAVQKSEVLVSKVEAHKTEYLSVCADPGNFDDTFTLNYDLGYHHFTLYYYDRAGNLMKTVPPQGVKADPENHAFVTKYQYNSLGQLIKQHTPDANSSSENAQTYYTDFHYDDLGQLRFSQNSQQKLDGAYSYTKYDNLGRIVEVGESKYDIANFKNQVNTQQFPLSKEGYEKTVTYYGKPANITYPDGSLQQHIENRVSYTTTETGRGTETINTYYSYDPHGNVAWIVQQIPELGEVYLRYEYDLISGNVLKVNYNEGLVDQFYHKYEYDEDNRIIAVYTSRDGHIWDKDASYDYYYHGPLQRMEVGEDKVQGIDYLYTIHGWLKGMNHPALDPSLALDPGNDGLDGSGVTGRDAFGMVLAYYEGDYNAPGANGFQSVPSNPYHLAAKEGRNLYNGNISTWASHILKNPDRPGSMQYEQLTGNEYVYDELNRIRSSHFKVHNTSWNDPAHTDEFHTAYTYDGNGNIASLTRNAYGSNPLMDRLTYYYQGQTNKLAYVRDNVPANLWTDDIDNQASTSNYGYDANGNLIRDLSEGIDEIEWTVYGKVSSITHDDGKTVHYYYDASGNRTMKHVKQGPHDNGKTTYYVRDASGNIMAVYEGEASGDTRTIKLLEQPIYGSDRIGERKETLIVKQVGGSPDNQDLRPREQVPSFRQWSLPLFTEKGTAMAKASTDGDLLEVISIDTPLGAGNATPSGMARDMEGNLQFSLVTAKAFNNAGNVSFVLDRNGDIMPFTYSQRSTAPVKVAPNSMAMTMKASHGAKLHWMFTVGGDGALYRHQIDMALKGNGTAEVPLGEVITTNEHLAREHNFLSPLMLIEDQFSASPMGYLYLLSQNKTTDGELLLWVYPQGSRGETRPILLDTFSGSGDGAALFVSPDGESLAVKVAQGRRLSLLPAHSWGEEVRLYDIGGDYQSLSYRKSVHLPGGKAYNSFAFSPDSRFLYFTDADLAHGYFLKRVDLETDDIVSLRPLYEGYSQVQLAANDRLYVSLSGTDRMVQVEHHAASPALSEISLGLPQGHVLAGALPIHSHMVRAMELGDDVYARVLGNKRYELKDHLGNVRVTLSDRKLSTIVGAKPQNYRPDILTHNNYYPFGMAQTGRYYAGSNDYRYGFNGKEKDNSFGRTNYDYGFRIYSPAIGKFLSVDPLTKSYPMLTPYQFASNSPIAGIDLDGLEFYYAGNGSLIGKYGTSTEVRVIKEAELSRATQAFADPENNSGYLGYYLYGSLGSDPLSNTSDDIQSNVLRSIATKELGIELGQTQITATSRYGSVASYSDQDNTININEDKSYFNDKNFILNAIIKENVHRFDKSLDETIGRAGRELNGYLGALKHESFKNAPDKFKTDLLQGAGTFIWQFQQEALITDNPAHKEYFQGKTDYYLNQFKKQGVSIDLSRAKKALSNNQEFYGKKEVRVNIDNNQVDVTF